MDQDAGIPGSIALSAEGSNRPSSSREGSSRGARAAAYEQALGEEYALEALSLGQPPAAGLAKPSAGVHGAVVADLEGAAQVIVEEPRRTLSWYDCSGYFRRLPHKLRGGLDTRLPIPPLSEFMSGGLGSLLGILAVSSLNQWVSPEIDLPFLVGSFGASAVLIFAVVESKLSQPRSFLGGQILCSLIGVLVRIVIDKAWIAQPVAVSLSIVGMLATSTTHPPGGATALIIAGAHPLPRWHGFSYCVTVGVGSLVMQAIALLVNNVGYRSYPTFWW